MMSTVDLSLTSVVLHSSFQFHAFAGYLSAQVAVVFQIACSVYAHDDHYHMHSKFNSLLTEMITPQKYKLYLESQSTKKIRPTDEVIMMKLII